MFDLMQYAEEIGVRIIQAGWAAYEDAAMQGLCSEGAWEVAVAAMRQADLRQILPTAFNSHAEQ